MSSLSNDDWIHFAKRCAVGATRRVRHGNEKSDAMTVGNEADRWWAYCQRCKRGAVAFKSHVLHAPVTRALSNSLGVPADARGLHELAEYERGHVMSHLASKSMDPLYFEGVPLSWSASRQRLLVHTQSGIMGRDTSGTSGQKWLTYERQHYILPSRAGESARVLLTEDVYSQVKVQYAVGDAVAVYCTLGTKMHAALLSLLLRRGVSQVVSFYDGDKAGRAGATSNELRLRALGLGLGKDACAPEGLDPKDLSIAAIREHVNSLFTN